MPWNINIRGSLVFFNKKLSHSSSSCRFLVVWRYWRLWGVTNVFPSSVLCFSSARDPTLKTCVCLCLFTIPDVTASNEKYLTALVIFTRCENVTTLRASVPGCSLGRLRRFCTCNSLFHYPLFTENVFYFCLRFYCRFAMMQLRGDARFKTQ